MQVRNTKIQVIYSFQQAFMWMMYCVAVSFSAVFMRYKGLSNSVLGVVQSVGMILGFALSSYLAAVIDRRGRFTIFHALDMLLAVQAVLSALFCVCDVRGVPFWVLNAVYICAVSAEVPVSISLCFELERYGIGPNFGPARAIGSLGYAVLAAALGVAVKKLGEGLIPAVGLVITALEMVTVWLAHREQSCRECVVPAEAARVKSHSTPVFLRANPGFSILLLGIIFIFFAHNVSNLFLINVVTEVGGDVSTMGNINSFTGILELPAMMFYGVIAKRFKCRNVLKFGLIMFVVKSLGIALAPNVPLLYAAESLQGVSFAVFVAAIVDWTAITVRLEDSAKGQALAQGVTIVGACVASMLGGIMLDAMSVRAVLLASTAACAVGYLICIAGMGKSKEKG